MTRMQYAPNEKAHCVSKEEDCVKHAGKFPATGMHACTIPLAWSHAIVYILHNTNALCRNNEE
jgi:hypothetical protein